MTEYELRIAMMADALKDHDTCNKALWAKMKKANEARDKPRPGSTRDRLLSIVPTIPQKTRWIAEKMDLEPSDISTVLCDMAKRGEVKKELRKAGYVKHAYWSRPGAV